MDKAQAKQKRVTIGLLMRENHSFNLHGVVLVCNINRQWWGKAKVISVLGNRYYTARYVDTPFRRKVYIDRLILGPKAEEQNKLAQEQARV